ncbi:MAG: ATP-binding protein [Acidobacteriota bacterium]|nr:ATP-binding protein [Acidobacteriota bacterium]
MFSVRARQIAGVTSLVGFIVLILTLLQLNAVARISLEETRSRAELLANAIYQSAFGALMSPEAMPDDPAVAPADPGAALRGDRGIRSILESAIAYSANVTYAAIVDDEGRAVMHSSPELEGTQILPQAPFSELIDQRPIARMRSIYSDATSYEIRQPMLVGDREWSVRIGVSTLLIGDQLWNAFRQATTTALVALGVALLASLLLSRWILRPIHVIRSGLTRLGRGESGVTLDLPPGEEFRELGSSFDALSAQLTAARDQRSTQPATAYETMVSSLEDAVALFDGTGKVMFANPAMHALLPSLTTGTSLQEAFPHTHDGRRLVEESLQSRRAGGPLVVSIPVGEGTEPSERQLATHPVPGANGELAGVMLVARNLDFVSQVHSTISYSRKLAALGRLFAGVTHEVKNPLNAMTIHLELMRGKLLKGAPEGEVMKHADVIGAEIKRLDEVVVNFLKFTRPEELKLEPVDLKRMITHVARTVEPEATSRGVTVKVDIPASLPQVNGDASMLGQVFMNLAVNAVQAMTEGGALRFNARAVGRRVRIGVIDTGSGISPENLARIFDLYFTTKKKGSGIGLSMVYRIIQLHDGEVEVQSTPGAGTQFRIFLPQA